ncbi:MAG: terminase large subunit domain-containing protein [Cyclobacteriaceae bacterium]
MAKKISPQPGFQQKFLSTPVDVAFGGGAAGAGKTFALLAENIRNYQTPGFNSSTFRRTSPQITNPGGLWDASQEIYPNIGATPNQNELLWKNGSGAKFKFSHLQHEKNKLDWQGTEIAYLGFDELTHFTEGQFFYLLSRNRSTCGVRPYCRATMNPDAESWIRSIIDWYIDKNGFIIPERDGKIRYFTRDGETIVWGDTRQEIVDKCPHIFNDKALKDRDISHLIKSFTFIEGDIYENKVLLEKDPAYLANLLSQTEEDKLRLFKKNWNVKTDGLCIYQHSQLEAMFYNQYVPSGDKCISVDAARLGSDYCFIWVWDGFRIIDVRFMDVSKTTEIANVVKQLETQHQVKRENVVIDADGVGGGVVDLLPGCVSFINNGSVIKMEDGKDNFKNLKVQTFFKSSEIVNNGQVYVDPHVASTQIEGEPLATRLKREMRVIRRKNQMKDGKIDLIDKNEMKTKLGHSPDGAEGFMMRFYLVLKPKPSYYVV